MKTTPAPENKIRAQLRRAAERTAQIAGRKILEQARDAQPLFAPVPVGHGMTLISYLAQLRAADARSARRFEGL